MKTFKEIREGFVSAAQRKAVWASRADGGKGHPDNKKKSKKEDAVADFLAKGGKIKKLPPAKAQGYHGKDDPGKGMAGMMDKGDTKAIGTRKKVKSMEDDDTARMYKDNPEMMKKGGPGGYKGLNKAGKKAAKKAMGEAKVDEISSKLAGRAYNAANKQTNYKKVTPTTAKKSDQGKKALAYHQRKAVDPSHIGTTYKGSGTDVAQDHLASSKPARKTAGKRIADLRKKGVDVDEAKQTHMFDNEKDARAKAKEIGGKYVKGTGKSTGKHAAIKESVASVAASAKGDHRAHMKAARAHAVAAVKHMDQYKETNDPAHQKAAKLHRKAEQSHEGTAKLHKTSNNGQTKMTRTSIANKATAAANAASEEV